MLCGARGQWLDEPFGLDLCLHCEQACPCWQAEPLPFEAFCLHRYEPPVDLLVTQLKFHGDLACARVLGTLLARALRAADRPLPDCIVPLPLHRSRLRERGFCQTTAIAHHLAARLRKGDGPMPVRDDLLLRVRATRAQSGLDASARAANLRDAFRVRPAARIPRHAALLDDVLTTGHTAMVAVAALRDAGIERVQVWCCARARRRDGAPDAFSAGESRPIAAGIHRPATADASP